MRTIHQFHFTASPGDAVTNHMRFLKRALAEAGIGGEIFAEEIKEGAPARRFDPASVAGADLLLVHHSHGNPRLADVLACRPPKALVYHNVTPSEFFRHDPYLASLSDLGRRQLIYFRGKIVTALTVSRYNARELDAMGLGTARLVPLLDLSGDDRAARSPRRGSVSGGELLFVGKITPHKNQALLVQVLYYLSRMRGKDFRLTLVGGSDPVYGDYVRLLVKALGIADRVRFVGKVTDAERDALYRGAVAFLCASRHEGFGVPLVEAMRHGLPVLAFPTTGARETLGGAGIGLLTKRPHRIAEIVAAALEAPNVVAAALESQERRLDELKRSQTAARAREILTETLEKIGVSADPIRSRDTHADAGREHEAIT